MEDLIKKAETLFSNGQLSEAEVSFQDALKVSFNCVEALNGLGVIAYTRGRFDYALEYFDKALALAPDLSSAQVNIIHVYMRQKKWLEAKDALKKLTATNNSELDIIEFAIEKYIELREYEIAHDLLGNAKKIAPENKKLEILLKQLQRASRQSTPNLQWPILSADAKDEALKIARDYNQISSQSDFTKNYSALHMASLLGNLHDPANAVDLPLNPAKVPRPSLLRGPQENAHIKGISILFAPMIIAGVVPELAKRLKSYGAKVETVDFTPNYLSYQADHTLKARSKQDVINFANYALQLADKFNIICLEFASSFKYHPNTELNSIFNVPADSSQPYADLLPLKDKGKKLFFTFWGSDCFSQSMIHYNFLLHLGFTEIPRPPYQTKSQYKNITAMQQIADAFVAPQYFSQALPKTVPFWNAGVDLDLWKYKKVYKDKITRILTAPTSMRKKNYELIQASLNSLSNCYPDVSSFCVQNTPHYAVPNLYAQADLGIDQATNGFGVLALEMMALGLPVVTNFMFAQEGAAQACAPILSFNNIRELYARISECIEDPQWAATRGKLGREYVEEYHDINQYAKAFSHYVDQALSANSKVWHIESGTFAEESAIWRQNPETVQAFKYFDISVPLFCAIGSYERAILDCQEAITNEYRTDKFSAWLVAIYNLLNTNEAMCKAYIQRLKSSNNKNQLELISHYNSVLKSGQQLLDEAARMFSEVK